MSAAAQACPAWLVDCGDTCNMPGVTCSTKTEQLCPVVPLKGVSLPHWHESAVTPVFMSEPEQQHLKSHLQSERAGCHLP
jgi:hypothetical protein